MDNNGVSVSVVVNDFPALSETFVINQIRRLSQAGFLVNVFAERQVTSVSQSGGLSIAPMVITPNYASQAILYRIADKIGKPYRIMQKIRSFARTIDERRALESDIVLCHFGPNGARIARAKRSGQYSCRLVTVFHGYDLSMLLTKAGPEMYRKLFVEGDLFLPVSKYFADRLELLGCPPEKIRVLHTGVDVSSMAYHQRGAGLGCKILTVCRLVDKKGVDDAVQSLLLLHRRRPDLVWTYEIVGAGPKYHEIRLMIEDAHLTDRIKLSGPASPDIVKSKIRQADIFALPSRTAASGDQEGIPVVLMEAAADGAALVSTCHSGIPELLTHGISALLTKERDPYALSLSLEMLISDPVLRTRLAKSARETVVEHFDSIALDLELHRHLLSLVGQSA